MSSDSMRFWARGKWRGRYVMAAPVIVLLAVGGYTASQAWTDIFRLPHAYDTLAARGVPTPARLHCPSGILDVNRSCYLTIRYGGRTRTWLYPYDYRQFRTVPDGSYVRVLVDPQHPTTA